MPNLTYQQLEESIYNYHHNDIFDHILLDEREPDGNIVTVVKYDEDTILVQIIDNMKDGQIYVKTYPNEQFMGLLNN